VTDVDVPVGQQTGAFGARLRELREAAGLTQEELAERAGLTSYAVSALERGRRRRPYPHTVRSLADALGISDEQRARLVEAVPRRSPALPSLARPEATPPVDGPPPRPAPVTAPGASLPLASAGSPLLGREQEVSALTELLLRAERRLVTLTGTGGVGKTRLATSVAAQVASTFPDGAAVVSLAPVADPAAVLPAVARAVGSAAAEGPDGDRLLAEHLRPLRFLLVLDNLEHLIEAAEQVAELVAHCPRLVVLVTSRAPLRVRGESEYQVQPLAVPGREVTGLADVTSCAAVAVFADRARAVAPGFDITADNAPAVAALCRRLAGIPLALELAAARIRFLSPQALLSRLDDAMARAGGPDLPLRQRTMRATFDWSYDLLQPEEQGLLRLLSVFSGGCTLDAVEDVSAAAGACAPVLPLLEVLVEHSLVVVTTDPEGQPRFGLLEPVAQYARSRQSDQERARLRTAHAACYLAFAERAAPEYQGDEQVLWLDRSEREDANLTSAISWSIQSGDGETAGRLCWALWLFWWLRGRLLVGRRLTEEAIELDMSAPVRTCTVNTAACTAFALGDVPAARVRWREAEVLAQAGVDGYVRSGATAGVGLVALAEGDLDLAEQQFLRSLPHAEGQGIHGDWLQSLVHVWLGTVRMVRGDLDGAVEQISRGLGSARRRGDRLTAYVALFNLSQLDIARGDHRSALGHLHEGIRLTQETGDLANLVYFLEALAVVESAIGEPSRVALLLGAAEAVREAAGGQVYGYYKPDEALREQAAADARASLGDDAYGDTVDAGRTLSPDEAVTYALTGTGALPPG
jgi:predicted ATPase/transcriptional regulator with XRE-family HTH domain